MVGWSVIRRGRPGSYQVKDTGPAGRFKARPPADGGELVGQAFLPAEALAGRNACPTGPDGRPHDRNWKSVSSVQNSRNPLASGQIVRHRESGEHLRVTGRGPRCRSVTCSWT